ncbi:MAG: N-glycosylase/DNA lyase [Ignavibacteriae bacterium]|nr:N-glycosylase/DNA lyase [Ignavibacteriota bacterium]
MTTHAPKYRRVDELLDLFEERKAAIRNRLAEFSGVQDTEYFYELVYCLLTPQSSAVNAAKAVDALKVADLFHNDIQPAELLHQSHYYVRFHNTKGKHLNAAKAMFPDIVAVLTNGMTSQQQRKWLADNVMGMGWKEASHFLRNIGRRNLAILDRHILKNLKRHNVIRSLPLSLTSKRYLTIERKFNRFADFVGITMDELDLLFWSRETGEILK